MALSQGTFDNRGRRLIRRECPIRAVIPPNVPHEFRFTQDTIDIDIFSPRVRAPLY